MCEKRRAEPRDDMITDLVNTTINDPDTGEERLLNMEELQNLLQQLMVAGNETTTSAITGGMVSLIRSPAQMRELQAHPEKIPNAVEEILRMESPSAGMWRVVTRDTVVDGVEIPKDSLLMLRLSLGIWPLWSRSGLRDSGISLARVDARPIRGDEIPSVR